MDEKQNALELIMAMQSKTDSDGAEAAKRMKERFDRADNNRFGKVLKVTHTSPRKLAESIGMAQTTIENYAYGARTLQSAKYSTVCIIADYFGVDPMWLVGLDD